VLAKIAHSFTVLYLGLGGFRPFLAATIIGLDDDVGRYVGGIDGSGPPTSPAIPGNLHHLELHRAPFEDKEIISSRIRLFSYLETTPTYVALTGFLLGEWPPLPRLLQSK
jgi:hypothetical protein